MAKVQKTPTGWTAEGVEGVFTSRDKARQALKVAEQEAAEATYAENITVAPTLQERPEDLEVSFVEAWGSVEDQDAMNRDAEPFRDMVRARENYQHMVETTEGPANRFWTDKLAAFDRGEY